MRSGAGKKAASQQRSRRHSRPARHRACTQQRSRLSWVHSFSLLLAACNGAAACPFHRQQWAPLPPPPCMRARTHVFALAVPLTCGSGPAPISPSSPARKQPVSQLNPPPLLHSNAPPAVPLPHLRQRAGIQVEHVAWRQLLAQPHGGLWAAKVERRHERRPIVLRRGGTRAQADAVNTTHARAGAVVATHAHWWSNRVRFVCLWVVVEAGHTCDFVAEDVEGIASGKARVQRKRGAWGESSSS
eukprot:344248-Chlamydomonas_euryale.AAC.1